MVFSSLLFLFLYLPVVLLIYYVTPVKFRNAMLFAANLVFYGWGEPKFTWIMIFSTVVDYVHGYFIGKYRDTDRKKAKAFVISSVVINLTVLGIFKYSGMVAGTLNVLPFLNIPDFKIPLPIGISFYTFQTMSYSIDVYRKEADVQKTSLMMNG